jgi:hypothetical protein
MSNRILVISHSPFENAYGASTSIREHYKALEPLEKFKFIHISKVSIKGLLLHRHKQHEIPSLNPSLHKTTSNVEAILPAVLPWNNNYEDSQKSTILSFRYLFQSIDKLAWLTYSRNIISMIDDYQPSLIHLNSLVLLELVELIRKKRPGIPIISHVREVLSQNLNKIDRQLIQDLDALIPIDYATEHRLKTLMPEYPSNRICRVQNPFMAVPFDGKSINIFFPSGVNVFAIIGEITLAKGVDFVCECFHEANLENAILIIFGDDESNYASSLKKHWSLLNKNILWSGHHDYLFERGIYNKIDVVVRGDLSFRTGRTVYEGLFSGSRVIIPGSNLELLVDSDLSSFSNKVEMYKPRDKKSLIKTFKTTQAKLKDDRTNSLSRNDNYFSNYEIYRENIRLIYDQFI